MRVRTFRALAVGLFLACASRSTALAPHEILLLVNGRSAESVAVAREFARLRQVPDANVVYLALPDRVLEPAAELSPAEFTRYIWEPAVSAVRGRGLEKQVVAWVYSVDFPVRVTSDPAVSLQGITMLRNELPDSETISKGTWRSPYFAGPDAPDGPMGPTHGLRWFRETFGGGGPIPSMMLGFTGSRGMELEHCFNVLRRGAQADGMRPTGVVCLVVSDDPRSRCRAWQFPQVEREAAELGLEVIAVSKMPRDLKLVGFMAGAPWIENVFDTSARTQPGAMNEHLTSAAGIFHDPDQSKLTQWLRYGITASAGTVSEPYANWRKFPHARFFAHYGFGCTMLESFFLSLRCPLQILLVGEPLCCPWLPAPELELQAPEWAEDLVTFRVACRPALDTNSFVVQWLLDGRLLPEDVTDGTACELDTAGLADGYHEVRAVAQLTLGPLLSSRYAVTNFALSRRGRSARITSPGEGEKPVAPGALALRAAAEGEAVSVGVAQHGRIVAETDGGALSAAVELKHTDTGRQVFRPFARYADGETVFGQPVTVDITWQRYPKAAWVVEPLEDDAVRVTPQWAAPGPERYPYEWMQDLDRRLLAAASEKRPDVAVTGGELVSSNGAGVLTPESALATCVYGPAGGTRVREVSAEVGVTPGQWSHLSDQVCGMVFNDRGPRGGDFFGLCGDRSAWVFGRYRKGRLDRVVSRGRYVYAGQWYTLTVRQDESGLWGMVDGRPVCFWEGARFGDGGVGILAGGKPAHFRSVRMGPPDSAGAEAEKPGAPLRAVDGEAAAQEGFVLRVGGMFYPSYQAARWPSP